jgi:hypothetical protein
MILGMSIATFTALHVTISLIAIVSGLLVVFAMFSSRPVRGLTALFLATTILTSVTGFMFPISGFTPALGTGIVSLLILAAAVTGLYVFRLTGVWRAIYIICAAAALYFNVFVLIVQAFQKVASLQALAPTQSEPPFLVAQSVALVLFVIIGFVAVKKYHPAQTA